MKIAVLLTNHFRSFDYIKDYLKKFWSEYDVDFYISTWDHDFSYHDSLEICKIISNTGSLGKNDREMQAKQDVFSPIPQEGLLESIKYLSPLDFYISSVEDFYNWSKPYETLPIFTDSSPGFILNHLGQIFSIEKGINLIKKSNIKYDLIYRTRMDTIQFTSPTHPIEEIKRVSSRKDYNQTLYTQSVRISKGFVFLGDRFLIANPNIFFKFTDNFFDQLFKVVNSNLYSIHDLKLNLFTHKMLGIMSLGLGINVSPIRIRDGIIRKDHVLNKVDLTNIEKIKEIEQLYLKNFKNK